MHPIPPKLRKEMAADPEYSRCLRNELLQDHVCLPDPRTRKLIEWEHALIYAGRQIQEKWAIIPICWWAHRGPGLNKDLNKWLALSRATPADFEKYPRANWVQQLKYLDKILWQ